MQKLLIILAIYFIFFRKKKSVNDDLINTRPPFTLPEDIILNDAPASTRVAIDENGNPILLN